MSPFHITKRILCLSAPIYYFDPYGKLRGFSIRVLEKLSFCATCLGSRHSHDRLWRFVMYVFLNLYCFQNAESVQGSFLECFYYGSIFSPQSLWGRVGQCFTLLGELGFVRGSVRSTSRVCHKFWSSNSTKMLRVTRVTLLARLAVKTKNCRATY